MRGNRMVLLIGAFALVSVAALIVMQQLAQTQGAPDGGDTPRDLALRGELGQALGATYTLLPPTDVTGDPDPEYIGYVPLPGATTGDMTAAKQMAISGVIGSVFRKPKVLLHLSPQGLLDKNGEPVLPQVASPDGYGFRLQGTADKPAVVVVLLDARGQPASDELSLVWDPKTLRFTPQQ